MSVEPLPPPVAERLQRVAHIELSFAQRTEVLANGAAAEQLARMRSMARQHYETLAQLAESRGAPLSRGTTQHEEPTPASEAAALERAVTAATSLASASAALYAAGRLLFEAAICDVANRHASEWVGELHAASELIPVAVIHQLVAEGEECRCICPACGIGACLCMRNSIETVRTHWGRAALEPSEGIELLIAPRAGSQLADAGVERGDRILAIDGEVLHDNRELQQSLRRGAIGEPRTALVIQGGSQAEITVARVSDVT